MTDFEDRKILGVLLEHAPVANAGRCAVPRTTR
jgi:hypothetical protein